MRRKKTICLIHTYWSIAFIVVVQGYFAFGRHRPHPVEDPKASPAPSSVSTAPEKGVGS